MAAFGAFGGKSKSTLSSLQNKSQQQSQRVVTPHVAPNAQYTTRELLSFYDDSPKNDAELQERLKEHGLEAPQTVEHSMGYKMKVSLEQMLKSIRETPQSTASPFEGGRSLFGTSQQPVGEVNNSPKRGGDTEALRPSENAFKVVRSNDLDEGKRVVKKVNGILNKLTPEKYDTLSQQLLDPELKILSSDEYMKSTIELIFARAVSQVSFCSMYANLARLISDNEVKSADGETKKQSNFRRVLLTVVQKEFEKQEPAGTDEEAESAKKHRLGNIQFIGELYNKNLLTDGVISAVVEKLLFGGQPPADSTGPTQEQTAFRPPPDLLEELCRLLVTSGKVIDGRSAEGRSKLTRERVRTYYTQLEQLAASPDYKPRIRIMLVNTLDLRSQGWPVKIQTAKKIEDLERENEEKERRKAEGIKHTVHSGEQTGWGKAAEISKALATIKTSSGDKGGAGAKKKAKAKAGNDGGFTAVTTKKTGKAQANTQTKKGQPALRSSKFDALGGASSPKDKSKRKDEKDKKDKKDKKESKDKDKKEDKEDKPMPPHNIPARLRSMFVSRAEECMRALSKDDVKERHEAMRADFQDYAKETIDDEPLEDPQVLVVHEIMRAITSKKDKEDRDWLMQYLKGLFDIDLLTRSDFNRGVAWFLATAGIRHMIDDAPKTYERLMEGVTEVIDVSQMMKTLQTACKGLRQWWEILPEEERLVEEEDLYDELYTEVFCRFVKNKEGGIGECSADKVLTLLNSVNQKANWPEARPDTTLFQLMVEKLLEEEWVSTAELSEFHQKLKEEGKSRNKVSVRVLGSMLDEAQAGEEVDEENEENEEDEEANDDAEADA